VLDAVFPGPAHFARDAIRRLQDRIDAVALIRVNEGLDLQEVRRDLELIARRGYHRHQDLSAKLDDLMAEVRPP
jgi:hypothetical protein